MACAQKVRPEQDTQQGQWASMFPAEQCSEVKSTLFVKKLLAVAVSTISYLRALFPEEAFGDRCLEDVQLKILRDDSAFPDACKVIQWLRGCFDALEKKYLKAVLIGIYENPEDPGTVLEEYSFRFSYGNGKGMDIYRNGSKILTADPDDQTQIDKEVKKSTIRLLRTIVLLSQTLTSLPDDVMMAMRLHYYDDITPEDYNPPGFKDCDIDEFNFAEEPMNIKAGTVSTNFHALKIRIKTAHTELKSHTDAATDGEEVQEENGDLMPNSSQENRREGVQKEAVVPSEAEELFHCVGNDFNDDIASMYPSLDGLKITKDDHNDDKENEAPPSPPPIEDDSIDQRMMLTNEKLAALVEDTQLNSSMGTQPEVTICTCGVHEDDGVMILCASCNAWQHAVCYAITRSEDAPATHYCWECAKKHDGAYRCTNRDLMKYEDKTEVAQLCLWRRALMAVSEVNRVMPTSLAKRLAVPMNMASSLVERMESEGFVKAGGKGKRFGKLVQKDELMGRGMEMYFLSAEEEDYDDEFAEQASKMHIDETEEFDHSQTEVSSQKCEKRKYAKAAPLGNQSMMNFDIGDSQSQQSPLLSTKKRRKTSIPIESIAV